MKLHLLLGSLTLGFLITVACAGGKDGSLATQSSPPATVAYTAPTGGGSGGPTFSTVSELAHHYKQDIIAPIGVPLGAVQTEVARDGALEKYGYWILGGMGDLWVFGAAPPSVADFDGVVYHNSDFVEIRRSSIVTVHGGNALLIQERHAKYSNHDSFRLLWSENGRVVQVEAASAGQQGQFPTVGPDALIAIANATRTVTLSEVDNAGILREDRSAGPLSGQVSSLTSAADASRFLGGPVLAPAAFSFIHVLHAGVLKSYTVDLDPLGTRRLFLSPESSADAVRSNPSTQRVPFKGAEAAYDVRTTASGKTSLLFFAVQGQNLMLRDANGASAPELVQVASAVAAANLSVDMDPATPGVQSVRSVGGPQDISVDIVLGDNVGNLGAFNFSLIYDDTRLTPGAAGGGGLAGNPDFNESALGGTWNCGLSGSPSADIDAATGPGHGMAFLSCFTTAAGSTIASATVIATLRLHVAASGTSSITIGDAHFAHYDATDIGTCDASGGGTMTCAGGSVTAP